MKYIILTLLCALSIINVQCMSDDESDSDTNPYKDLCLFDSSSDDKTRHEPFVYKYLPQAQFIKTIGEQPSTVTLSSNGKLIALVVNNNIKIYTTTQNEFYPIATIPNEHVQALRFSDDNTKLCYSNSMKFNVFDIESRKKLQSYTSQLTATSDEPTSTIWDESLWSITYEITRRNQPYSNLFTLLLLKNKFENKEDPITLCKLTTYGKHHAVSPDTERLAYFPDHETITIIDIETKQPLMIIDISKNLLYNVTQLIMPDSESVLAFENNGFDSEIFTITKYGAKKIATTLPIEHVEFSPQANLVAARVVNFPNCDQRRTLLIDLHNPTKSMIDSILSPISQIFEEDTFDTQMYKDLPFAIQGTTLACPHVTHYDSVGIGIFDLAKTVEALCTK